MVDIQSAAAEIRRGKKKIGERKKTRQKYNGVPYPYGDHKKVPGNPSPLKGHSGAD